MVLVDVYARLSDQEKRRRLDAETQARCRKLMWTLFRKLEREKIHYHGPEVERIKDITIPHQIELGLKWAATNKYKVYRVCVDYDVSGAVHERKNFEVALQDVQKGVVQGVVIKNQSRLARDVGFWKKIRATFKDAGGKLWFVQGQEIADDELSGTIIAATDEVPVHKGRQSYREQVEAAIEEKRPFFPPTYGYRWNKDRSNWVLHKERAKHVLFLLGNFAKGVPYKQTCMHLKIHHSTYYRILANMRTYAGFLRYKAKRKDSFTKKVLGWEWKEYEGSHHTLLTGEQLAALEQIAAVRKKGPTL